MFLKGSQIRNQGQIRIGKVLFLGLGHEEEGGGERHLEIISIKNNEYVSQRYLDDLQSFNEWKERTFNKD